MVTTCMLQMCDWQKEREICWCENVSSHVGGLHNVCRVWRTVFALRVVFEVSHNMEGVCNIDRHTGKFETEIAYTQIPVYPGHG